MRKLPLFPLSLVMFPNSRYPLHIFEPRYKIMIGNCIRDNSEFGIAAFINNSLSKVGCSCIVEKTLKNYENGELDIVVRGTKRFRILSTETHSDGYIVGEIEDYEDASSIIDRELTVEVAKKFEELTSKLRLDLGTDYWNIVRNSDSVSYKIAEKAGLSIEQRQDLLSLKSETKRLYLLKRHIELAMRVAEKTLSIDAIVLNDGYIN